MANQGAAAKPGRTDEEKQQIRQEVQRLAQEKGLNWKSMSQEERKELKRSARQQLRSKSA